MENSFILFLSIQSSELSFYLRSNGNLYIIDSSYVITNWRWKV